MIGSKFQNCATKIKANNKVRQSQFIWVAAKSKGTESNRKTEKKTQKHFCVCIYICNAFAQCITVFYVCCSEYI